MAKFNVSFIRTRTDTIELEVEAKDDVAAQEKAEALIDKDLARAIPLLEWEPDDDHLDCNSVDCLEEDEEDES
jgi:hypothetical protein